MTEERVTFEFQVSGKRLSAHLSLSDPGSVLRAAICQECVVTGLLKHDDMVDIKVIWKGKNIPLDETLLSDTIPMAQPDRIIKLLAILSPSKSIANVHQRDQKYENTRKVYEYAVRTAPKPSPDSGSSIKTSQYTCHTLEVLPGFTDSHKARALLDSIRSDHGIRSIMNKYQWSIGLLSELHPNERTILGYNQNKGQKIALRLRTDDLAGFRSFDAIRKVMIHELTHMYLVFLKLNGSYQLTCTPIESRVHSDHNDAFHALCRDLERQVASLNTGKRIDGKGSQGWSTAPVSFSTPRDPTNDIGGAVVLGGASPALEDKMPHRDVLAKAALSRLTKQEIEITEGCGTESSPKESS